MRFSQSLYEEYANNYYTSDPVDQSDEDNESTAENNDVVEAQGDKVGPF